jgi:hypothetical protein
MQLTAPLMHDHPDVQERLQASAEPAAGPAGAAGDGPHPPMIRGVEMENPVGLAVADGTQDDGFSS